MENYQAVKEPVQLNIALEKLSDKKLNIALNQPSDNQLSIALNQPSDNQLNIALKKLPDKQLGMLSLPQTALSISGPADEVEKFHKSFQLNFLKGGG